LCVCALCLEPQCTYSSRKVNRLWVLEVCVCVSQGLTCAFDCPAGSVCACRKVDVAQGATTHSGKPVAYISSASRGEEKKQEWWHHWERYTHQGYRGDCNKNYITGKASHNPHPTPTHPPPPHPQIASGQGEGAVMGRAIATSHCVDPKDTKWSRQRWGARANMSNHAPHAHAHMHTCTHTCTNSGVHSCTPEHTHTNAHHTQSTPSLTRRVGPAWALETWRPRPWWGCWGTPRPPAHPCPM
jgi:hypothetical protein